MEEINKCQEKKIKLAHKNGGFFCSIFFFFGRTFPIKAPPPKLRRAMKVIKNVIDLDHNIILIT